MKLAVLIMGPMICFASLKVHAESIAKVPPAPSTEKSQSMLNAQGHGFAIEYIDLMPHQKGQDNGVYDASVTITPVSLPNLDLPKFQFRVESVHSINEVIEGVKPKLALQADEWIKKLQQDAQAFDSNRRALSPLPNIESAIGGGNAHATTSASKPETLRLPQMSKSATSVAPDGFDLNYLQFVPQHRQISDGLYKVTVSVTPRFMPDAQLPFVYQILFRLQFENIRSIAELKEKVRPQLAKRIDALVDGMRKDKQALEQDRL